jgi:hypothetical protein
MYLEIFWLTVPDGNMFDNAENPPNPRTGRAIHETIAIRRRCQRCFRRQAQTVHPQQLQKQPRKLANESANPAQNVVVENKRYCAHVRLTQCDRQNPCQNCIKREEPDSCEYESLLDDQMTLALRSRLEELEAQVREITSLAAPREEKPGEDDSIIRQFAELQLRPEVGQVYQGPRSQSAMVAGCPELERLFNAFEREGGKWMDGTAKMMLEDDPIITSFPFPVVSDVNLRVMLPEKYICDRILARYFDSCNTIYDIIEFETYFGEQYPLLWSFESPPTVLLAHTFLMLAIGARSLNDGHWLTNLISPDGQAGTTKLSQRWRKYGQLALSQSGLLEKSNVANIQAVLLLGILEDVGHVRWNMLGMVANMATIAGLHRDPDVFKRLDENKRDLRR